MCRCRRASIRVRRRFPCAASNSILFHHVGGFPALPSVHRVPDASRKESSTTTHTSGHDLTLFCDIVTQSLTRRVPLEVVGQTSVHIGPGLVVILISPPAKIWHCSKLNSPSILCRS